MARWWYQVNDPVMGTKSVDYGVFAAKPRELDAQSVSLRESFRVEIARITLPRIRKLRQTEHGAGTHSACRTDASRCYDFLLAANSLPDHIDIHGRVLPTVISAGRICEIFRNSEIIERRDCDRIPPIRKGKTFLPSQKNHRKRYTAFFQWRHVSDRQGHRDSLLVAYQRIRISCHPDNPRSTVRGNVAQHIVQTLNLTLFIKGYECLKRLRAPHGHFWRNPEFGKLCGLDTAW